MTFVAVPATSANYTPQPGANYTVLPGSSMIATTITTNIPASTGAGGTGTITIGGSANLTFLKLALNASDSLVTFSGTASLFGDYAATGALVTVAGSAALIFTNQALNASAALVAVSGSAAIVLNKVALNASAAGVTIGGSADLTVTANSLDEITIYGADLILSLCGDVGCTVSTWTDQSGAGNHFTQSTSGQQFTKTTGGDNGKTFMDCNGSNSTNMTCASFSGLSAGSGVTAFIVLDRNSTSTTLFEASKTTSGADSDSVVAMGLRFNGRFQTRATYNSAGVTVNSGDDNTALGGAHIFTMDVDTVGHNLETRQDSGTAGTGAVGADTLTNTATVAAVGCTAGQAAYYTGRIYRVIVAKVNDATKRASMIAALKTYYGIS